MYHLLFVFTEILLQTKQEAKMKHMFLNIGSSSAPTTMTWAWKYILSKHHSACSFCHGRHVVYSVLHL